MSKYKNLVERLREKILVNSVQEEVNKVLETKDDNATEVKNTDDNVSPENNSVEQPKRKTRKRKG